MSNKNYFNLFFIKMSNFRKFISMSAVAVLGVTNLLTPLSYASAATVDDYDWANNPISTAASFSFLMPDHHVYLKATTEPNRYSVTYSGTTKTSWTMEDSWYTYDLSWDLRENAYEKIWYTFSGWRDDLNNKRYADKAEIKNLTTAESGNVPIYAEWSPNTYSIDYALNDASGTVRAVHNDPHPNEATYDDPFEVSKPTRTWYTFSGWDITNMDSHQHLVGWVTGSATTASGVKGTEFNNLRATSGTVHFAAKWTANKVPYKVEHYLQDLSGAYSILSWTDNLTGTADTEVKPATGTYTWFKPDANTPYSGNIKPDGTQVFTYKYDRQSYDLTVTAGRWIATATAKGTVNTGATAGTGQSKPISFLYDEPVTLSLSVLPWYQSGTWSGYEDDASSFNMPAFSTGKTAYATPIEYTITYNYSWATYTPSNTGIYTVETPTFTLVNPSREHSKFAWWIGWVINGTQLSGATMTVTIPKGSLNDRSYTATWTCLSWYHLNDDMTACIPDSDTDYHVRHYFETLTWGFDHVKTTQQTWETEQMTDAKTIDHVWFTPRQIDNQQITWDGSTTIDIRYDRNNYTGSVVDTTWVSVTHHWAHDSDNGNPAWHHQYDDVVTIEATTGAGYTFSGWTITDGSGNDITSTLLSGDEITSTTATFNMPASEVKIKANVTTNVYDLTIISHGGLSGQVDRTYTVEDTVTLKNPNRPHSDFVGWSWTDLSQTTENVTFSGRAKDSTYEEVWKCHTGYHEDGPDKCVANEYTVTIDYKDNGNDLGSRTGEVTLTYDSGSTIPNPTQSWYTFSWWIITGLSGDKATVDGEGLTPPEDTTTGTLFKNLTPENWGNVTFVADWTPNNDTHYVVYHYYENVENANYTLSWTNDYYDWTTDDTVTFAPTYVKNKSWFQYVGWYTTWGTVRPTGGSTQTTKILKDGSTEIYLYYQRSTWMVHLSGDEHVSALYWTRPTLYSWAKEYKYEATVNVSADAATWYHFKYWLKKKDSSFNEDL